MATAPPAALPLPADAAADARAQMARAVREKLARTTERLRLARLLAGGGFAAEAGAPLEQALETTVDSLYQLADAPASTPRDAIVEIERHLVKPGLLSPDDSARIPWLHGLLASQAQPDAQPLEPALVERMVATVERLAEAANVCLTARAL